MTESSPEVAAEQAYLDHAHVALAAMRARAARNVEIGERRAREEPGPDTSLLLQELERRHAALADSPVALAFGRLDEERGDRFYVGRRHVEDAKGDAVVVDWRADVSIPFYRATWADPMGIDRRRRFALDGREVVGVFDEDFADPHAAGAGGGGGVPDPLLAELERGRTGEMRDIVATIQAEQDEVIRAPLDQCLVVQGGPGTGKTAVGLHRAAFLLFEHRDRLERTRLLVVGPNSLFLRYIAQVLPSLGETAVTQTTLPGLLESRFRVRAVEAPAVAMLKGDPRMPEVIRRAARSGLVTAAPGEIVLSVLGTTVRIPEAEVQGVLDGVHARDVPLRAGRDQLRGRLERLALDWYTAVRPSADEEELRAALRTGKELTAAVNRLWPVPSPPVLVRRLLGNRQFLAASAAGVLSADEQALLHRRPNGKQAEERWTRSDLGLLDEADFVVGGPPRAFGHVVVDEAQDHSAMELRLLARRSPERSMTILGDLAQATASGAQSRWVDALAALDAPHGRVAELELGYRVPAPVLDFANRLLPVAAPGVLPSRSVRAAGQAPTIHRCATSEDMTAAIVATVSAERDDERSVGIVAPEPWLDAIADALRAAEVVFTDGRSAVGLGDAVTLIPPESAKGLEFDAVIVVEPSAIADIGDHGLRLLYIALTRAVRTLTLIHTTPLPEPLR
ncbi:MAG: HelD family protein [Acidimicrobiia bacterium]